MNTVFINNEQHISSPKWCIDTFKLAEKTEVDQEERGQPTHMKMEQTWHNLHPHPEDDHQFRQPVIAKKYL